MNVVLIRQGVKVKLTPRNTLQLAMGDIDNFAYEQKHHDYHKNIFLYKQVKLFSNVNKNGKTDK